MDCLAFGESGIKAFGYFGKRSAYLMSKEKDGYNNDEHVFEYRTDNEGYIREITVMIHFDRRSNGFYIIKSTLLAPDILYLKFIL